MSAQRIGACKATPTAPLASLLELSFAYKLLLSGMQALVALPVVLAGERLPANGTDKRTLVSVGAQMGAEVVGTSKPLWAERALESRGVLLHALGIPIVGTHSLVVRICQPENVFPVWQRGC
jgi:hypothetical protein